MRQRRHDASLEQLLRRRESLHGVPQPRGRELAAVSLHHGELLGDHGGGSGVQAQAVGAAKSLMGKGQLGPLVRLHQCEEPVCAGVNDQLVQFAQQSGADSLVTPTGMQGKGQQIGVVSCRPSHCCAHEEGASATRGGDGHRGRLMFIESFDDVAAAIGDRDRCTREVDQLDDRLQRGHRIPMVQREDTPPVGGHDSLWRDAGRRALEAAGRSASLEHRSVGLVRVPPRRPC